MNRYEFDVGDFLLLERIFGGFICPVLRVVETDESGFVLQWVSGARTSAQLWSDQCDERFKAIGARWRRLEDADRYSRAVDYPTTQGWRLPCRCYACSSPLLALSTITEGET